MSRRGKKPAERGRDVGALLAFIDSRQAVPHAWGRKANDCCSFPIEAIRALTGHNPCPGLRWTSRRGALLVIKRRFGTLEAAFDHYLVRIPPALAKRGDVAGVPDEAFGVHPMIVEGDTLVAPGERGLKRCPRRHMTIAWSATLPKATLTQPLPQAGEEELPPVGQKGQVR